MCDPHFCTTTYVLVFISLTYKVSVFRMIKTYTRILYYCIESSYISFENNVIIFANEIFSGRQQCQDVRVFLSFGNQIRPHLQ